MNASRDGFLFCALLLALACGATDPPAPEAAAGTAPAADKPSIAGLSWLLGEWEAEQDGKTMNELWTHPHPKLILGMHRDFSPSGEEIFFEHMQIEERTGGIVFKGAPKGQMPAEFLLEKLEPSRAVFYNPEHDYPQRISYWLADGDLHARVEGDTPEGKKSSEWTFYAAD